MRIPINPNSFSIRMIRFFWKIWIDWSSWVFPYFKFLAICFCPHIFKFKIFAFYIQIQQNQKILGCTEARHSFSTKFTKAGIGWNGANQFHIATGQPWVSPVCTRIYGPTAFGLPQKPIFQHIEAYCSTDCSTCSCAPECGESSGGGDWLYWILVEIAKRFGTIRVGRVVRGITGNQKPAR